MREDNKYYVFSLRMVKEIPKMKIVQIYVEK